MIWTKKHGEVLAACDKELLGKRFKEQELELYVNEDFYKGELTSEDMFSKLLDKADNINLVGEETIKIAERKSLIADVKKIQGIPFTIILKFSD